jgi:hypothetical protein
MNYFGGYKYRAGAPRTTEILLLTSWQKFGIIRGIMKQMKGGETDMGSLEFFVDPHQPAFKTVAEQLCQSPTQAHLPRAIRHAIKKEQNISFDESRLTEDSARRHVLAYKTVPEVEAIVEGSRKEMQSLYKQIKIARGILTKLERSYLYHYFRSLHGNRILTKVKVIPPGVSSKRPTKADQVEEKLSNMPEAERQKAEATLKKTVRKGGYQCLGQEPVTIGSTR